MATNTLSAAQRTSKQGTTIFLKTLMAVSGVAFIGFVAAHMYGNLKLLSGQRSFNDYAEHLRTIGEPMLPYSGLLWILRVGLIVALVAHVASAVALTRRARAARPQKYAVKKSKSAVTSRTMRWGGLTLLLFLVFHLLQFTAPKINVTGGETNNPFALVQESFEVWWVTLIYLAAMVALGMHLHHGVWSAVQTLGLTTSAGSRRVWKAAGAVTAVVIAGGFALPPLLILFDVIN
ncbi:succinate dehydrogenase cytochrome b subunit [Demetria terragena]|uniref:succinate dehydrogenase cytochrome b subunit n=1 Tax=Demetria terragena TaxID=63959 RepID=UPI0003829E04|nr:succinate dehydrogenase cytochrome b subunit [Demetria terragena]